MTRIHCRSCAYVHIMDDPEPDRGWCHYYPAKAVPGMCWPSVDLDEDWCSFARAAEQTPPFLADGANEEDHE